MGSRNSHKNFSKTTHFLIGLLVALIINFLGFFLCKWLNLPILGDSIGTVFMAVSFGPAAGMVVGGLTAFVTWALGFAPSLSTVSGIIVGLIAGLFLSRKSNYDYFKRTYKNHKEMLKRYVKDEEEWYEKAKYDDEICFDPDGLNDLEKIKEQYSNYFENE